MHFSQILLIFFTMLAFFPNSALTQIINDPLPWEEDIRHFEHLDSVESYSPESVIFAGSSSIRLWSTLSRDMSPYPVIQRGYGGAKLSDLVIYAERILYPHACRAIVLFVANDITGNQEDKEPEEIASLFDTLLYTIRKKFPDQPVFWIGITPTALRWDVWPAIVRVNCLISDRCRNMKNTFFIRTDDAFLNGNGQPIVELFMEDRLHLNERGYEVWSAIIRKELGRVLEPAPARTQNP
jgi:hypothetical protein